MKKNIILLSILFYLTVINNLFTGNIFAASNCTTETISNGFIISNCPLQYAVKDTIKNTKKQGIGPSPYFTDVQNTTIGKTDPVGFGVVEDYDPTTSYRVMCKGEWMIDASGSNWDSFCNQEKAKCKEEKLDNLWIVGNCPLNLMAQRDKVINTKKSGIGPSPYFTAVENTIINKKGFDYGSRSKCEGDWAIDTSGEEWFSYCSPKRVITTKPISFTNVSYDSFTANWELPELTIKMDSHEDIIMDESKLFYNYGLYKGPKFISSGGFYEDYINIKGLEQGTDYRLQVIAMYNYEPSYMGTSAGNYSGSISTGYQEKQPFTYLSFGQTDTFTTFKRLNGVDSYKLEVYTGENGKYDKKVGDKTYEKPLNPDSDCTIPKTKETEASFCYMSYEELIPATDYSVKVLAYKGGKLVSTFEGKGITSFLTKPLSFNNILSDSFTFSREGVTGLKFYYNIYNETNNLGVLSGMYEDTVTNSYNTKTGKYKNNPNFPLKPGIKYSVKVQGVSGGRTKIEYSGVVTTDGDDITVLKNSTKITLNKAIGSLKTKYLADKDLFNNFISQLNTLIEAKDSNTVEGKGYILKANYVKDKLQEIIDKNEFIVLKSDPGITFSNIESNGLIFSWLPSNPEVYTNIYYSMFNLGNNSTLIEGGVNNPSYILSYNTKTGKFNTFSGFPLNSCTAYGIKIEYNTGYHQTYRNADVVTKGCDGVESEAIKAIGGLSNIFTGGTPAATAITLGLPAINGGTGSVLPEADKQVLDNAATLLANNGNGGNNQASIAALIGELNTGISTANLSTEEGKNYVLRATYLKTQLEASLQQNEKSEGVTSQENGGTNLNESFDYPIDQNDSFELLANLANDIEKANPDTEEGKIAISRAKDLQTAIQNNIKKDSYVQLATKEGITTQSVKKDIFDNFLKTGVLTSSKNSTLLSSNAGGSSNGGGIELLAASVSGGNSGGSNGSNAGGANGSNVGAANGTNADGLMASNIKDELIKSDTTYVLDGLNNEPSLSNVDTIIKFVKNSISDLLLVIIIGVFLFMGIRLVLARGNPEELKKTMMQFVYVAIGIFVIAIAWAIVTLVSGLNV